MKIARVPIETALKMRTFGAADPVWKDPLAMKDIEGVFVRLDPPLNTPDEDISRMRAQAVDLGARSVKVQPVRRDAVVYSSDRAVATTEQPHLSARDVVATMCAESRTKFRSQLEALLEETMQRAGL